MSYAVEVTAAAERDLAGIAGHLSGKLGNPAAALRVLDEFEELVDALEQTPWARPAVRDELLALAGYRWAAVGSYMAFFTVNETSQTVCVERVLHGSRNWRNIVGR